MHIVLQIAKVSDIETDDLVSVYKGKCLYSTLAAHLYLFVSFLIALATYAILMHLKINCAKNVICKVVNVIFIGYFVLVTRQLLFYTFLNF